MEKYLYKCNCGWEKEYWIGSSVFTKNSYADIGKELNREIHPTVKLMWKELLDHPLLVKEKKRLNRGEMQLPLFLRVVSKNREKKLSSEEFNKKIEDEKQATAHLEPEVYSMWILGRCSECDSVDRFLLIRGRESKKIIHKILCNQCGEESVQLHQTIEEISCPSCENQVQGKRIGIE